MDELVLRGMAKWPNVPAVYGWLALDRRGQWLIKGERISNRTVTAFIGRNYARDDRGCWFFQNGPQRVFVSLEYAPLVLRIVNGEGAPLAIETHNGKPVSSLSGAWMDENGAVLMETEHGVGTVHDRDLDRLPPSLIDASGKRVTDSVLDGLMEAVQRGQPISLWLGFAGSRVKIEPIASGDAPSRFRFVGRPEPPAGEEVCR